MSATSPAVWEIDHGLHSRVDCVCRDSEDGRSRDRVLVSEDHLLVLWELSWLSSIACNAEENEGECLRVHREQGVLPSHLCFCSSPIVGQHNASFRMKAKDVRGQGLTILAHWSQTWRGMAHGAGAQKSLRRRRCPDRAASGWRKRFSVASRSQSVAPLIR